MVVALGPGQFYGSSLPRPRFFPGDRVDPPASVTEPLLAWAQEAHWSMGGLGVKRLRLQGRIEGSIDKLRRRVRRDARAKARAAGHKPASLAALGSDDDASDGDSDEEAAAAQERILKREVVDDDEDSDGSDQSEDEPEEGDVQPLASIATAAKKRARKLSDEFDRIAVQQQPEKKQKASAVAPARTSPRRQASAPATKAPARTSPKRQASAPAAGAPARASPRRKAATSAPMAGARRTSPRNKH
jgi:hypothetical protein